MTELTLTVAQQSLTIGVPAPYSLGSLITGAPPVDVDKSVALVGSSDRSARDDHKHDVSTSAASSIGAANAEGTATTLARSDHDHLIRETGGPTDLTIGSVSDGEFVKRSGGSLIGATPSDVPVTNFQATAVGDVAIASAVDVLVGSMTLTPGAGDYLAMFGASANLDTNLATADFSVYVNGVQVGHTVRTIARGGGATFGTEQVISIQAVLTGVLAAQAVEVRASVDIGTMNVHERTLTLLKVG